jgi:hypothetical protein
VLVVRAAVMRCCVLGTRQLTHGRTRVSARFRLTQRMRETHAAHGVGARVRARGPRPAVGDQLHALARRQRLLRDRRARTCTSRPVLCAG